MGCYGMAAHYNDLRFGLSFTKSFKKPQVFKATDHQFQLKGYLSLTLYLPKIHLNLKSFYFIFSTPLNILLSQKPCSPSIPIIFNGYITLQNAFTLNRLFVYSSKLELNH